MKEIAWQAFLKFPIEVQTNIIGHAAGPLAASVWSGYKNEDGMKKLLRTNARLEIRFHSAVIDTVKRKRGVEAADMLRAAM